MARIRTFSIVSVLVLFILSACSTSKIFTFTGESENWSAKLKVTQANDFEEQEFTLQYKGKDVKSVGEITYKVDTNAGGFGGTGASLDKNGILENSQEANPSNAKVIKESDIDVIVEWNNHTEEIKLKLD
ncbi:hypothetical protein ACFFHF_16275 [Robertmurraya beringensis]|uniref:Lipoprotein n=1 Tax=Robertmurraya beringensis TaxID=641660 RepID=A0ABV6KU14_9BACI